ncbi:hypothetical protein D3C76_1569580 [compost metagenome]
MENLQATLQTVVDGVTVSYGKVLNQLAPDGWHGIIYFIQTSWKEGQLKHDAIVGQMARQLEAQSYDHGSEWVEQKREIIFHDQLAQISLVSFRIRDSY